MPIIKRRLKFRKRGKNAFFSHKDNMKVLLNLRQNKINKLKAENEKLKAIEELVNNKITFSKEYPHSRVATGKLIIARQIKQIIESN